MLNYIVSLPHSSRVAPELRSLSVVSEWGSLQGSLVSSTLPKAQDFWYRLKVGKFLYDTILFIGALL